MAQTREDVRLRADAEKLAEIFGSLQRCFVITLSEKLAAGHLSIPQYCLLSFLEQQPGLTMSEISQKMRHTTAATTGLVDRLEKSGHVRRTHGLNDRRKVLVEITASGLGLVSEVRDEMVDNLLKIMEHLSDEEQRMWVQIYEKVIFYCQNQ